MEDITDSYVKGWVDRQSQIRVDARAIVATATEEHPIRDIFAFLRRLGIQCTLIQRYVKRKGGDSIDRDIKQWELRIGRREDLELWREKIGFLNKTKAQKLEEILSSYV